MTSKITYLGNLRTEAQHTLSGEKIITDAPPDNQGRGEAFSPTDLAATSLGSCMMTIMAIAARDRGIDMDGATAEVTKRMAVDPYRRIAGIHVKIVMPPGKKYAPRERKLLETAAHGCPVSRSLSAALEQVVEIVWPD